MQYTMSANLVCSLSQERLPDDWQLSPITFTYVLTVVTIGDHVRWHLFQSESVYKAALRMPPPISTGKTCSAVSKLDEVIHLLGISLSNVAAALDMGELIHRDAD